MRRALTGLLVMALLAAPGVDAATRPKSTSRGGRPQASKRVSKPYQVGNASWYGKYFHGRLTASGEPYNMFELTAAHRVLPLGTVVRVTNLRNGKAVVVRINDRGPVPRHRIIDLSYGAAQLLGLRAHGIQRVRLDVIETPRQVAYKTSGELAARRR